MKRNQYPEVTYCELKDKKKIKKQWNDIKKKSNINCEALTIIILLRLIFSISF